jgi:hypothetical protein
MEKVMVTNPSVGDKVVRGEGWSWGSQDKDAEYGIIDKIKIGGWARVTWYDKDGNYLSSNSYRIGAEDKYDLHYYIPSVNPMFSVGDEVRVCTGDEDTDCDGWKMIITSANIKYEEIQDVGGKTGVIESFSYDTFKKKHYYKLANHSSGYLAENCLHLINHKTQTHEKSEIRDSPIKVQGPIGTITTGEKRAGTTIQGRRSSTSISSGRVSYKEVYSFR